MSTISVLLDDAENVVAVSLLEDLLGAADTGAIEDCECSILRVASCLSM